jgi:hypothetical protein
MAAAIALAVATGVALAAAPSRATYPGANGLLVYQASVGDHVQLFTIRPDGTHLRQVTGFTDSDAGFGSGGSSQPNAIHSAAIPSAAPAAQRRRPRRSMC